jgi:NDP-sugar pyrophosphorylase family protein
MSTKLSLRDFVAIDRVLRSDLFKEDEAFFYLGKSLTSWIENLLNELGVKENPVIRGTVEDGAILRGRVYISEGAKVEPTALIEGPCYIGPGTEVRHGAYVRGSVYAGSKCVIGHTTEVKGAIFMDGAKAGHFAYVGDSILGRDVNLGAGTKLANLKLKKDEVRVTHPKSREKMGSGLKKFGAIMGDGCQTGCNAVLSPGTLLMPGTGVMPCVHYHGTLTEGIAR